MESTTHRGTIHDEALRGTRWVRDIVYPYADIGGLYSDMDVTGFAVDPAITIGAPGTAYGPAMGTFGFPPGTIGDARAALMGPNLRFHVVPGPSTSVMIVICMSGIRGFMIRAFPVAPLRFSRVDRAPREGRFPTAQSMNKPGRTALARSRRP